MSKVICIMGESGSGKTTSMRNLPPEETYYIDCDKKGLSWKGWRDQYGKGKGGNGKSNYVKSDDAQSIMKTIRDIHEQCPHIHYIVIDTLNGIMVGDEMRRAKEKGYDKWVDLAQCVWEMVDVTPTLRDDLTIIFIAHTQTERDDSGYMFTRIKTSGKKIDKICLESKFTTVLLAKAVGGKYVFETTSKNSTAKSPMGAFESDEIENDIMKVIEALKEY